MSEFQMTHVALVGARMQAFKALGYRARSDLALRRVVPAALQAPREGPAWSALDATVRATLPCWVHNAIVDPALPARARLLMSLRRFEGELRDHRDNAVIAAVLSAGFRNRTLDPLALPDTMPLRQRCLLLMHIGPWQAAYQCLEGEFGDALGQDPGALADWVTTALNETELSSPDAA